MTRDSHEPENVRDVLKVTCVSEPPMGLANMAAVGCLLNDAEQRSLGDWTVALAQFVSRLASLDPALGLLDARGVVGDARALIEAGSK